MAAATSPADPTRSDAGGGEPAGGSAGKPAAEGSPEPAAGTSVEPSAEPAEAAAEPAEPAAESAQEPAVEPAGEPASERTEEPSAGTASQEVSTEPQDVSTASEDASAEPQNASTEPQDASAAPQDASAGAPQKSWRFSLTRDTARPEGGGRAASGDAPAPARQWPLLAVLVTAALGLLLVATDPFAEAFRIGSLLIGVALLIGAVLRWVVPSVGMLAVRSRFTDLVTYGVMGTLIVLLALMAQPKPWLDIPVLEDAVHFTIR